MNQIDGIGASMIVVWVLQASLIVSIYFLSGSFTAHSYQLGALFFWCEVFCSLL